MEPGLISWHSQTKEEKRNRKKKEKNYFQKLTNGNNKERQRNQKLERKKINWATEKGNTKKSVSRIKPKELDRKERQ